MKILSFDPGLGVCGFCLSYDLEVVLYGVIETSKEHNIGDRLLNLEIVLNDLLARYKPNVVIAEKPVLTMGGTNTAVVNYAYAVLLMSVANLGFNDRFIEYSPSQIKKGITGVGRATKEQVLAMIKPNVKLPPHAARMVVTDTSLISAEPIMKKVPDDAIDAVASNWHHMLQIGQVIRKVD